MIYLEECSNCGAIKELNGHLCTVGIKTSNPSSPYCPECRQYGFRGVDIQQDGEHLMVTYSSHFGEHFYWYDHEGHCVKSKYRTPWSLDY